MARNLALLADALKEEYIRGMPDGLDEQFFGKLNVVFRRIAELERALDPFAHVGKRVIHTRHQEELVQAHTKDCVNALAVMDPENSLEVKKEFFYPA